MEEAAHFLAIFRPLVEGKGHFLATFRPLVEGSHRGILTPPYTTYTSLHVFTRATRPAGVMAQYPYTLTPRL